MRKKLINAPPLGGGGYLKCGVIFMFTSDVYLRAQDRVMPAFFIDIVDVR